MVGFFIFENPFGYFEWVGYAILAIVNSYFTVKMILAITRKYTVQV